MKKLELFLLLILLGLVYFKQNTIVHYITKDVLFRGTKEIVNNEYYKDEDYLLVKNVDDITPKSKDDFNNIIYTVLNSGMDKVSLYCSSSYENCISDFNDYTKNSEEIEVINNYVDPFNSFKNISVTTDSFNRITINVTKNYSNIEINFINKKMDEFIQNNINDTMSDREKIKLFHDYIINNTKYDSNFKINTDKNTYTGHPYNAFGVLAEGKGICGGYSDVMSIYLDKLGINNYRIASNEHIWNYVYLDNSWYHLDLTWDDPVTNTGEDVLIYDFFLIDSDTLANKKTSQHHYNKNLYLEAQ